MYGQPNFTEDYFSNEIARTLYNNKIICIP